jgi:DNA-directed RNA polymerase specialized sigma subunit
MCRKLNLNSIGQILNQHHSEPMTLREIAEHEGVSHQAVSEILDRALRKIKKAFEDRGITLEDLI